MRIVYFDIANTINDAEVQTRLGMQSLFVEDWAQVGPDRVQLVGEWECRNRYFALCWVRQQQCVLCIFDGMVREGKAR